MNSVAKRCERALRALAGGRARRHRRAAARPTRNQIIAKGMIWSPNHGDTLSTVPLLDAFMHRIMPGEDWRP